MSSDAATRPGEFLRELEDRLHPKLNRDRVLEQLDELFLAGRPPDPRPQGFLRGRLVTTATFAGADAVARLIAGVWMPWLGKSFDPQNQTGVNVLLSNARMPMRAVWPGYTPEREGGGRLEAFPFTTRIEAGALDPQVEVLKIDYDWDANPDRIVRHILDELVQVDEDTYLGKILYRGGRDEADAPDRGGWRPIGFFSLHR